MQDELSILIQAEYPLIYLVTPEETRAEAAIASLVEAHGYKKILVWTITQGLVDYAGDRQPQGRTLSTEAALRAVVEHSGSGVFIFKDLHPFLDSPGTVRCLRDVVDHCQRAKKHIILVSPYLKIPPELEKDIVSLNFPIPTLSELDQVLSRYLDPRKPIAPLTREKLGQAALGLTKNEAEKIYRKAQLHTGQLADDAVEIILSEKKRLIHRSGILEFIEVDETIDVIGGLDELKHWLTQRSNAFTKRARSYGLPQPKGMLILGVPGCGKSLLAKTTARLWGLPLLRLDMGRVYDGSTVGKSEANLRNALAMAESISPVILFIDEIDKSFAGSGEPTQADGGTSRRIFGSFLTWMQDKTAPVFVMATANRVDRMPSEFVRKGRFDEIFFVDLPTPGEREIIFRIHLLKRRPEGDRFDCAQLARISDGFSGAEIEQAIVAAMYEAFAQDREFTQLDIIAAIKATLPLSRTMTEQVSGLRDWARDRARPASASLSEYQRLEF